MNGYEISLKLCATCDQYCRAITLGNKLAYGRIYLGMHVSTTDKRKKLLSLQSEWP